MDSVRFGIIDYSIFTLLMAISLIIGIYYAIKGRKNKSTKEFLLANRNMDLLPVTLSMLATFISATTLLGMSSEVYLFGSQHTFVIVSFMLLFPIVGYIFLPIIYNLEITSIYEYLERRFNNHIRKFAAALFIIQTVLYLAVVILSPALALNQATGLYHWVCSAIVIGVCTIYTSIGGIRAVMWTDVVQIVIMFSVILAIIAKGIIVVGGVEKIWTTSLNGGRVEFFNTSLDPRVRHTVWTQSIGGLLTWLPPIGIHQAQVQRYLASKSLRTAQNALWLNLLGWSSISFACAIFGFIMYTYYLDCDPLSSKVISRSDQLLPAFVMEIMGNIPGFPGIFISALLCGSLSTLSTGLNSLAAITYEDFIKAFFIRRTLTERLAVNIIKGLAVFYGVACFFSMELIKNFTTVSEAAAGIFGLVGGPILGIFILGMFFPCSNSWGAATGMALGFAQSAWIIIGSALTKPVYPRLPLSIDGCNFTLFEKYNNSILVSDDVFSQNESISLQLEKYTRLPVATKDSMFFPLYSVSYMWYSLYSCTLVISFGLLVSWITGRNKENCVDAKLLSPIIIHLMKKYPKKKQHKVESIQMISYKYTH